MVIVLNIIFLISTLRNIRAQEGEEYSLSSYFEEKRLEWLASGWQGKLKDGTPISPIDLISMLDDHSLWMKTNKAEGKQLNLSGANISGAYLANTNLAWAVMQNVDLSGSDLTNAILIRADLSKSNLESANLFGTTMAGVNLSHSSLNNANLTDSDMEEADLRYSSLVNADLRGAEFKYALLQRTNLTKAIGLDELKIKLSSAGIKDVAEKVTCEIKRTQRLESWQAGFFGKLESTFNFLMFEITCDYGCAPARPLAILIALIPICALIYITVILGTFKAGIWIIQPKEKLPPDERDLPPKKVNITGVKAITYGVLFSLLTAFEIGWKEFTIKNWITRILPKDFSMAGTGWIRNFSGIQSIVCLYLFVLWLINYFGTLFK